jgi:hypothetical protein
MTQKISLKVNVEQFNALHNLTEEKCANVRDIPAGHPCADDDAEFFSELHRTIADEPRASGTTAQNLDSMRWVSFARCWLSLQETVDPVETATDPEFDWFSFGFDYDKNEDYDHVLLREIKASAKAEGHRFPQDIEKTLRVMLHG